MDREYFVLMEVNCSIPFCLLLTILTLVWRISSEKQPGIVIERLCCISGMVGLGLVTCSKRTNTRYCVLTNKPSSFLHVVARSLE